MSEKMHSQAANKKCPEFEIGWDTENRVASRCWALSPRDGVGWGLWH